MSESLTERDATRDEGAVEPVAEERTYRAHGLHNGRIAFRRWRRTRPFWGGLWCILGGAIIAYFPAGVIRLILVTGTVVWAALLMGLLVMAMGAFLWFTPQQRHLIGFLAVLFSLVSFITSNLGGFMVGMTLGIVGGAMGFAWVPAPPLSREQRRLLRAALAEEPPEAEIVGRPAARRAPAGPVGPKG